MKRRKEKSVNHIVDQSYDEGEYCSYDMYSGNAKFKILKRKQGNEIYTPYIFTVFRNTQHT